jgi:hypothetical protein
MREAHNANKRNFYPAGTTVTVNEDQLHNIVFTSPLIDGESSQLFNKSHNTTYEFNLHTLTELTLAHLLRT